MLQDFFTIFYWWLLLLGLGLLFLPLNSFLFQRFWDRGWVFSKILAIITISYLAFFLGWLRLLPFYRETIFLIILLIVLVNLWWLNRRKNQESLREALKSHWRIFLFEELLFFLALAFWSFIRGFQPDIEGLEKFMDFGFVNSILRSVWFPPKDMWFAGEPINYYYFGHLQAAVLTKLSGFDSALTYNLMIATIFALAFTATFSLTSNLVFLALKSKIETLKPIILAGLISAFLLTLGGNLHTIVYVLKDGKDKYWYPDATRFIGYRPDNPNDKTIHEFPSYSFVVADLHGHMNDIPTTLLFMAILLALGFSFLQSRKAFSLSNLSFLIPPGFLLAIMYMTNSWDFPIYGVLFALFTLFLNLKDQNKEKALFSWFIRGLVVLVLAIVLALPFALSFEPMTQGVAFVRAHSLWWQLLILWGFFWFLSFGFWLLTIKLLKAGRRLLLSDLFVLSATIWATVLIIIPEIIYVKDIYIPEYHRANTMFKLTYQSFIIYSLSAGYIFWRIKQTLKNSIFLHFYISIFLIGFSAQMIYPYFAIKGYYGGLKQYHGLYGMGFLKRLYPDNYRAVLWLKENIVGQPVILEAVGDSYTHYNHVSAMTGLPTIEGWLVHEWLWRGGYDQPGARAAEVGAIYQGDRKDEHKSIEDQTDVSFPTTHEVVKGENLWRIAENYYGSGYNWIDIARANHLINPDLIFVHTQLVIPDVPARKKTSISLPKAEKPIIENDYDDSQDGNERARQLLEKYQIKYVVIGPLEREKYPALDESRFSQWGRVVFSSGETKIYYLDQLDV